MGKGMGGWGSGFQGDRKHTVEEGLILSIRDLNRVGALAVGWRESSFRWRQGDHTRAAADYSSTINRDGTGLLGLHYMSKGEGIHDWISLVSTVPHYGGRRWWFKCPSTRLRTSKLYLPPGADHFASRQAHDLTYRSCQESGEFGRRCRRVARYTGRDEAEVRNSLLRQKADH
jgi:hypothetical protein